MVGSHRYRVLQLIAAAMSWWTIASTVAAQQIALNAAVSDSQVRIGSRFVYQLQITVMGSLKGGVPPAELPDFAPFREINRSISDGTETRIVGSQRQSKQTRTITVDLQAPVGLRGTYTIPAASAGGRRSLPISVTVIDDAANLPDVVVKGNFPFPYTKPSDSRIEKQLRGKLFAYSEVSKADPYIREPIQLTWHIYEVEGLGNQVRGPLLNPCPSIGDDFVVLDCEKTELKSERVEIEGVPFLHRYSTPISLLPKKSGELTIGGFATVYEIPLNRGIFFGSSLDVVVPADPVTISVKPLPGGAPPEFNGAVGQFEFSARVDRDEVEQGADYINFTATARGPAFIDFIGPPTLPELDDFRIYEEMRQTQSSQSVSDEGRLVGVRSWESILVAERPGEREIPPVRFAYFDPEGEEYVVEESAPIPIQVALSEDYEVHRKRRENSDGNADASDMPVMNEDYAFISRVAWPDVRPTPDLGPPRYSPWLLAGLAALFLIGLAVPPPRAGAEIARRRSRALKAALQTLQGGADDDRGGGGAVEAAIRAYLADKTGRSPDGISSLLARQLVEEYASDADLAKSIETILDEAAAALYAPGGGEGNDLVAEARDLLEELERRWPKP